MRQFALYGETDEFGLPVRYDWASDYRGSAVVVYGHTPVPEPEWIKRTVCIDTGCVFSGRLTALRYPEKQFVSVPAAQVYYAPVKPFAGDAPVTAVARDAQMLDFADVSGKRVIDTRVLHRVTVREENAVAALEVMSRFATDPRWLVYLPPTMAPPETAADGELLERPQEAIAAFRHTGVAELVAEEKHMGSRALPRPMQPRSASLRTATSTCPTRPAPPPPWRGGNRSPRQAVKAMVLKPAEGLARGPRGLAQPALKCRGREYLRIIYGPEYTAPENLARLRQRRVRGKQSLALREFALGLEALYRFVEHEPLYRVHEGVFGVLALESEPMDARL